ncbi:hypothetical protein Srot_2359 [Segniliparus rotundus DSM 44985]|uniref:Uncharacterized protein n=1 Tax=Segniliparus rotundus (strain ATCC BAA-972 / CDC 1076 / CIP 108378 / DSM 44985 / JCM 13578) TaxID=640132 RepID=D6ZAS1_SEGRD|nr:hypothetical protein [Segniliparus rotundus]ADG98807.1 hypothetical protein Srot_2359 [Segniliparus rotundus DSM 44985]
MDLFDLFRVAAHWVCGALAATIWLGTVYATRGWFGGAKYELLWKLALWALAALALYRLYEQGMGALDPSPPPVEHHMPCDDPFGRCAKRRVA